MFVLEAFVPDVTRFDRGQSLRTLHVLADEVDIEASLHDPVTQTVKTQVVVVSEAGTRLPPIHIRYAWPTELDLMARLAGLELRERWGGPDRSPFSVSSDAHVSVYARG